LRSRERADNSYERQESERDTAIEKRDLQRIAQVHGGAFAIKTKEGLPRMKRGKLLVRGGK